MAIHKGTSGSLRVFDAELGIVAEVKSYTVEENADTVETTVIGDTARTFKTSITGWTGSMDVFWDETDELGQGRLFVGNDLRCNFFPMGVSAPYTYYRGDAIVTSVNITGSFDGMVEASITVQGYGPLDTVLI